jgi:hypothetical protein
MNEAVRNKLSDAEVTVNNEEGYKKRLEEVWVIVDKQKVEIAALRAQVQILKEVVIAIGE